MSLRTSLKNSEGFTLVEVMVAILIMMVGMFGLLETLSASMQHNLRNQLRDEGVRVGERYMTLLRGKTFASYSGTYTTLNVPSAIRGVSKSYKVEMTTQPVATDTQGTSSVQLSVVVKWAFRNMTSLNRVVTVVARP